MVVSTPVRPACQPSPVAASYWPVFARPSSPAAEPLSEEAPAQHEMMGARMEPEPHRGAPLLGPCCI